MILHGLALFSPSLTCSVSPGPDHELSPENSRGSFVSEALPGFGETCFLIQFLSAPFSFLVWVSPGILGKEFPAANLVLRNFLLSLSSLAPSKEL